MNQQTLLHRQVNSAFIKQGRVTSQIFQPTKKDNKKLSVDDGDMITAEESWEHFNIQFNSEGILSVSSGECTAENLDAYNDPQSSNSAHAVIDFDDLSKRQIETCAKVLRDHALNRGWQYTKPAEEKVDEEPYS